MCVRACVCACVRACQIKGDRECFKFVMLKHLESLLTWVCKYVGNIPPIMFAFGLSGTEVVCSDEWMDETEGVENDHAVAHDIFLSLNCIGALPVA